MLACPAALALAGLASCQASDRWEPTPGSSASAIPSVASSPTPGSTEPAQDDEPDPTASPRPGEGGLTDRVLGSQVWDSIQSFYKNVRNCDAVSWSEVRVTQAPDASGSWEESWTVTACENTQVLRIKFTVTPGGDVYYDITE